MKTKEKEKQIIITTTVSRLVFRGRYLPEMQRTDWHYYMTSEGKLIYVRKEFMVSVEESDIPII